MPFYPPITLPRLQTAISEIAAEIQADFPDPSFGYAGIIPIEDTSYSRYDSTPLNAKSLPIPEETAFTIVY